MFTVKIRFPSGSENIFEARRVEWLEGDPEIMPGVLIHYEDGGASHYGRTPEQDLRIWVMNRNGSTVAAYRL